MLSLRPNKRTLAALTVAATASLAIVYLVDLFQRCEYPPNQDQGLLDGYLTGGVSAIVEPDGAERLNEDRDQVRLHLDTSDILWQTKLGGPEWVPLDEQDGDLVATGGDCARDLLNAIDGEDRLLVALGSGGSKGSYVLHPASMVVDNGGFTFLRPHDAMARDLERFLDWPGNPVSRRSADALLLEWNKETNGAATRNKAGYPVTPRDGPISRAFERFSEETG